MTITMSYAHSPTFPSLHLRHNSLSNPSVTSPTSQLTLQPFRHVTYVTTHSPTLPSRHLRHNSLSNPSVTSPTSQLILQPFFRFSHVTGFSLTSPGEPPMTWRASPDEWSSHLRRVYQQGAPSFLETGKSPTVPDPDCTEDVPMESLLCLPGSMRTCNYTRELVSSVT